MTEAEVDADAQNPDENPEQEVDQNEEQDVEIQPVERKDEEYAGNENLIGNSLQSILLRANAKFFKNFSRSIYKRGRPG